MFFEKFSKEVKELVKTTSPDAEKYLEKPKRGFADLALPCFAMAADRKSPVELASELSGKMLAKRSESPKKFGLVGEIKPEGPYINFFADKKEIADYVLKTAFEKHKRTGKTVLIEHTSINPNASPHVGRSRNAVIGDSIRRLYEYLGYKTEIHYYVNDIGKQIAVLVLACSSQPEEIKFEKMLETYVRVNEEMKKNPDIEQKALEMLNSLEHGDKKTAELFKRVVKTCVDGQRRIMEKELGVHYDHFDYESTYVFGGHTERLLKQLEKTGKLFTDENGRKVLDLSEFDLAMKEKVFVMTRADGTSLYGTRDICYNIDKIRRSKNGANIVVLGEDQKLYSQQVAASLKLMGYKPPEVVHYSFILLPTGKMSTRSGNVVLLEDFMKEARSRAFEEIEIRHPHLTQKEKETRARMIALGAVRFSIIRVSPDKNVLFNLAEALSFEGDTGPYVQYTHARACSILKKAKTSKKKFKGKQIIEYTEDEFAIIKKIAEFPELVERCSVELKPYQVAQYLIELAGMFNEYYHHTQVIGSDNETARLKIVEAIRTVIKSGLYILGIDAPEEM